MAGVMTLGLALLATLGPGLANGERIQRGTVIVSVNGGISPRKLPRDRPAPVGLRLDGRIQTADGSPLPQVRQIEIELAGRGLLSTHGLPVCPRARILNASSRQAMRRCGPALVGSGRIDAALFVPHQRPLPFTSRILAFNGRIRGGGSTVWIHAYSSNPPVSIVLPFIVQRRSGRFRTALTMTIPDALGPLPHIASFHVLFFRRFRHGGRWRSYLSATCPVPPNFTAGFLSFARATYHLTNGRTLRVESVRSCRSR
jgi:hypothetical protein